MLEPINSGFYRESKSYDVVQVILHPYSVMGNIKQQLLEQYSDIIGITKSVQDGAWWINFRNRERLYIHQRRREVLLLTQSRPTIMDYYRFCSTHMKTTKGRICGPIGIKTQTE